MARENEKERRTMSDVRRHECKRQAVSMGSAQKKEKWTQRTERKKTTERECGSARQQTRGAEEGCRATRAQRAKRKRERECERETRERSESERRAARPPLDG